MWLILLRCEIKKLRRTLALRLAILLPLMVVILQLGIMIKNAERFKDVNFWTMLIQGGHAMWAIMMLPLLVPLLTALLTGMEHQNQGWKHMYALPVAKGQIINAKITVAFMMVGLSCLSLILGLVIGGQLVASSVEIYANAGGIPWSIMLMTSVKVYLGAWTIIVIHFWIGYFFSSFVLSLGAGVVGVFFAVFATAADIGTYFPWLFPVNSISNVTEKIQFALIGSPVIAILLMLGGYFIAKKVLVPGSN